MTQNDLLLTITDYGTRTGCKVEELAGYYGEIMRSKLWEDLRQLEVSKKIVVKKGFIELCSNYFE